MKIVVKNIKGGSSIVEVNEHTSILDVKKLVENDIKIPWAQQTLVLFGKTLQDEKSIGDYPKIKDMTKLHAAVKKAESLQVVLARFLRRYYSDEQCNLITEEFMRIVQSKMDSMSLDDLERIAKIELSV
ncbi:unnamed protein product [Brassicogethes aeneus]|uniref:Ubiquitin-like domain-containing protein n=1 Tax=Brassicogethes aeneus TaxID=1431903 RepID=A0A9P0BER2_BRAAE|nr:unnamed protein product [Brassicogethes aeneus]